MEKKIGAYICTGCGIGEALDIEQLTQAGIEEPPPAVCRTHPFLCSEEGLDLIRRDMAEEGVNTLVIAACSPRMMTDQFVFDPTTTIVERVNLREQVAWSHQAGDENTQELAEDYLRMGLVKADKTTIPAPEVEEVDKTILVVGGGIAGLTAAYEAAEAGYEVVLVEKEAKLGGWAAKFPQHTPRQPPYGKLARNDLQERINQVQHHAQIKVFTGAEIEQTSGAPGMFEVTLRRGGDGGGGKGTETLRVGAIVQATGWRPYPGTHLESLGFGRSPNVITNVQLEEMATEGYPPARSVTGRPDPIPPIKRPSDGQPAQRIAFIQCAGSRDEEHLAYCSGVCCLTTLKEALYIRERNPEAQIYIFYKDMRTPGQNEDLYRRVQEDEGVFFTKGEVVGVEPNGDDSLSVEVENTLLGEDIRVEADLVVLATGMVPNTVHSRRGVEESEDEEPAEPEGETSELGKAESDGKLPCILNLQYRLGEELPLLKYEFPDSHFICFPYETQRTGIYAAGCVRRPQNIAETIEDATGAAMKAIQCVEMTARGEAVHPRAGDRSVPDFRLQRCTQCKRCTEECPFGTLDEDEKATPMPNPTRCRRCGICLGACPERIISFETYSVDMIASMIKAIHVPDEFEEKPRVIAFFCENDAYPSLDMVGFHRLQYSPYVRAIPVRCLGSVNVVWIADALASGIDGIMLFGCKSGDDYQCHFIKGSELAGRRMENVQEALDRLVLERDRVHIEELDISEYERIPTIIEEFMETIDVVGPNPYKGF